MAFSYPPVEGENGRMQKTRNRKLPAVLTLLTLLTVIGWKAADAASLGLRLDRGTGIHSAPPDGNDPVSGDPDTPQVTKRLGRAPGSDATGGRGGLSGFHWIPSMGRVWVGWYFSRWLAR